jgi:ubiquitin-protein ligase
MSNIIKISPLTEKRLRNEVKDLVKNKNEFIQGIQDDKNIFIFYFLLKGSKTTCYEDGYYLGKILLPQDYPNSPGDFIMLTPNGRFDINNKICLSNTGYHANMWNPLWSIRNILLGIYSIWLDDKEKGLSHINESQEKRKIHAKNSVNFNMQNYKDIFLNFNQFVKFDGSINNDDERITVSENVPKNKLIEKNKLSKLMQNNDLFENNINKIKNMNIDNFDFNVFVEISKCFLIPALHDI